MARLDIDWEFEAFGGSTAGLTEQEIYIEELCKEILNESAPILQEKVKSELRNRLIHEGDSELIDSMDVYEATKAKNGAYIVSVRPTGYSKIKTYKINRNGRRYPRKYKLPNVLKAIWKEYGIPGKQPPSPFFGTATRKAEKQVLAKMQEVYERKTGIK